MKKYEVMHMVGVAGIDERQVEREFVEAANAPAALAMVTDWPGGNNPDSTQGGSERYNDYWYAEEAEEAAED